MKWLRVTKTLSAIQVYNLVDNNITKASIRYHPAQQSIRFYCSELQRVFFVDTHHYRNNIFGIKNEYGFLEAKIQLTNEAGTQESGVIEYKNQRIEFTFFHNNRMSELVIYREDGIKPLEMCTIEIDEKPGETALFINKSSQGLYASLIWGLYWHCTIRREVKSFEIPVKQLTIPVQPVAMSE